MPVANSLFFSVPASVAGGVARRRGPLWMTCLALVLIEGCTTLPSEAPAEAPEPAATSKPAQSQRDPSTTKKTPAAPAGLPQTGLASWYGAQHHGKKTASGAIFDQAALTAAHRSLPFGTQVKVTNLANGRSVEVEINDRGPYAGNRIIDLSQAAAKAIGMIETGTANVRIESPGGQ